MTFPLLHGGLPFLYENPNSAMLDWRARLGYAMQELDSERLLAKTTDQQLPGTAARMQRLSDGLQKHQDELKQILNVLEIDTNTAREMHQVLGTSLPTHHGVLSYMPLIFRDWVWGQSETNLTADHIIKVLANHSQQLDQILVLGAGAGGLAYELQQRISEQAHTSITVTTIDSNPLLSLIAWHMANGSTVELTEFPDAPLSLEDIAVTHHLTNSNANEHIKVICADAMHLPVPLDHFDLVLTPWLIDVIDAPLTTLLQQITRALKPEGLWLNHGPLGYSGHPASRLSAIEISELTQSSGYDVLSTEHVRLPYLESPHGAAHRSERLFTQLARRGESVVDSTDADTTVTPEWMIDASKPVPFTPAFKAQLTNTRIHGFVMGLINGERSINEMARIMENERLMPAEQAKPALKGFLRKMLEEANTAEGVNR
ncbi:MAG: class I SAM-dependent methyltransferase [Pseudomonadota bacterium]